MPTKPELLVTKKDILVGFVYCELNIGDHVGCNFEPWDGY